MREVKDHFSGVSQGYKKYRPKYPMELYDEILRLVKDRNACWDCATGNGQAALELSKYFDYVYATDVSQNQLAEAQQRENIKYSIQRAEKTDFVDDQFDLITVAQAIHWFDLQAFENEVQRVIKPNGILAFWAYGLMKIDSQIDDVIDDFYVHKIGVYWNVERKHVDEEYQSINLGFEKIKSDGNFAITVEWSVRELEGYLNTWSSVKNYRQINNHNPVDEFIDLLRSQWTPNTKKRISFPVFLKTARVRK